MKSDDRSAQQTAVPRNLERRRFLEGALLCLSGVTLTGALAAGVAGVNSGASLRGALPDTRGAARVGRLYLDRHPQEATAAWLEATLFGGALSADARRAGRDQLMRLLQQGRLRDFRNGDVVVLDGWFFARTEARLLALVALRAA